MANNPTILPITDTIKESWQAVSGAKSTYWTGMIVAFLITFSLGFVASSFIYLPKPAEIILRLFMQFIGFLMQMGLVYMGIKRARGEPIDSKLIFYAFDRGIMLRLIGVYCLQFLILGIPIALFLTVSALPAIIGFPGISIIALIINIIIGVAFFIISFRMMLSVGFVLDKHSTPVIAIKQSFEATKNSVWQLIGLVLLQTMIIIVSAIPLGIGLIWTLPLSIIIYGMIYKKLLVNVQTA